MHLGVEPEKRRPGSCKGGTGEGERRLVDCPGYRKGERGRWRQGSGMAGLSRGGTGQVETGEWNGRAIARGNGAGGDRGVEWQGGTSRSRYIEHGEVNQR